MAFIVFLRCVSEAGFYFLFAGTLGWFFGARPLTAALGLALHCLCLTAGFLMREKRSRYLTALLPALFSAFIPHGAAERLVLLPMSIYMLKLLRSGEYEPTWDHEAELFSRFWKLSLAFMLLSLLFGAATERGPALLETVLAPDAAVTMISLIMLMRALRHDRDVYTKAPRQLAELAVFALLLALSAILGSHAVLRGVGYAAKLIFFLLIYPVLNAAMWLAGQILRLVGLLLSLILKDEPFEMPSFSQTGGLPDEVTPPLAAEAGEGSPVLRVLLIAAGAGLLAFAAYKLLKTLLLRGTFLAEEDGGVIERAPIEDVPDGRQKNGARTPPGRVRREYRRFLRLCRQRGIDLRPGDTSLSVEKRAAASSAPEEIGTLRRLYIAARYGDRCPDGAAERAEETLKRIKTTWGRSDD